jgi:hypothetical protein
MKYAIAKHFLSQFTRVKSISRFSPTASKLAHLCRMSYPDEYGGVRDIRPSHIVSEASELGIITERNDEGEYLIGINADEVKKQKKTFAIYDTSACRHGFVLMTLIEDPQTREPAILQICPQCKNGLEVPSKIEVESAKLYLLCKQNNITPTSGALIMAARALGYIVDKNIDGKPHIFKPRNVSSKKAAGDT